MDTGRLVPVKMEKKEAETNDVHDGDAGDNLFGSNEEEIMRECQMVFNQIEQEVQKQQQLQKNLTEEQQSNTSQQQKRCISEVDEVADATLNPKKRIAYENAEAHKSLQKPMPMARPNHQRNVVQVNRHSYDSYEKFNQQSC